MRDFSAMPYRPAKLMTGDFTGRIDNQNMEETNQILQIYITCDYPGPSRFLFVDNVFADWRPFVTYERALNACN
jgi:hypothetical protein